MEEAPVAQAGHDENLMLDLMVNAMRDAIKPYRLDPDDMAHHSSLAMTAACILAGTIFGEMTVVGIESTNRNRRKAVSKIMDANFSAGIHIALSAAARLAKDQGSVQ
jgi:hypothetical protein